MACVEAAWFRVWSAPLDLNTTHSICRASRPNQVVFIKALLMDSPLASPTMIYCLSNPWRS